MINCLSSSKFANLLFVNVQIGDVRATALFDTGAGMTVIAQSLLRRLRAAPEKEVLRAGNNNGVVRALQTAVIPNIRLGDVCMENCKVLVTDDADFALGDESGRLFPAEMLLGWDVISRYRWSYSAKDESLSVSLPEKTAEHLSPEIKQGPIVFPEYAGRCFKARVDTGHTGSILSASWYSRLSDIAYHETEIAGVGADAAACIKSTCYSMAKSGYTVHVLSDCITSYDKKKLPELLTYYASMGCSVVTLSQVTGVSLM